MPNLSRRQWLLAGMTTAVTSGLVVGGATGLRAADPPAAKSTKGEVTLEGLGNLLSAIRIEAKKTESRYDFAFATKVSKSEDGKESKDSEEWQLSMSVVLSDDQKSIWIMAWLNELPKSAQDVPRTALLRLLADNDKMGNGQFFAYIPSNRRFILQRVIPNENITTAGFKAILIELGHTVTEFYGDWAVANWKTPGATGTTQTAGTAEGTVSDTAANSAEKKVIPAGTKTTAPAKSDAPSKGTPPRTIDAAKPKTTTTKK